MRWNRFSFTWQVGVVSVLVAWLVAGCATNIPPSVGITAEQLTSLEAAAEKAPDDAAVQKRLFDVYLDIVRASGASVDRTRAIAQARKIIALEPGNARIHAFLYGLLADRATRERDSSALEELSRLYESVPALADTNMPPPVYFDAILELQQLRQQDETSGVKGKLKRAIALKPNAVDAHRVLGSLYSSEGHHALAIAVLSEAAKRASDDVRLQMALGTSYENKAREKGCSPEQTADLKGAAAAYKAAAKLVPNNPRIHYELALTYELLGAADLYLFEARRYHEIAASPASKLLLADALVWYEQPGEAIRLYDELFMGYPRDLKLVRNIAQVRFMTGDWQGSMEMWKHYRDISREPHIYAWLVEGLAIRQLKGEQPAKRWLQEFPAKAKLQPWEQKLLDFHLGTLSADQLLSAADNACKLVEARFYIGYQHWMKGETAQAKTYFAKAVGDTRGYPHIEHAAARYALKRISPK